jgi:hypothetical protein
VIGMATNVNQVYFKPFHDGTLFVLRCHRTKKHSTMDNQIKSLEATLRIMHSDAPFKSISDMYSGKLRSFGGNNRLYDPLFREIFDLAPGRQMGGVLALRPNVKVWTAPDEDCVAVVGMDDNEYDTHSSEGSKYQCIGGGISALESTASKKHAALVEQLFNPDTLREIEEWDAIEKRLREDEEIDALLHKREGIVYWADTPTFPGILKNGGSRFDGATRVRQLFTAGVLMPFTLRHEFKVTDWKLYEGAIHEFNKETRLFERKEFFAYTVEEAVALTDKITGKAAFSEAESVRWTAALDMVSRRLSKSRERWARKKARRHGDVNYSAFVDQDSASAVGGGGNQFYGHLEQRWMEYEARMDRERDEDRRKLGCIQTTLNTLLETINTSSANTVIETKNRELKQVSTEKLELLKKVDEQQNEISVLKEKLEQMKAQLDVKRN